MTLPFAHDDVRRAGEGALDLKGADEVEVVFTGSDSRVTRYANSEITQNIQQSTVRAHVRVAKGRRFASVSTNQLDPHRIEDAAVRALEAARHSPEDPAWPGLPNPAEVGRPTSLRRFHAGTASFSAERRARGVADILAVTSGSNAAGVVETSSHAYAVLSSRAVDCFDYYSRCVVSCLADIGEATGYKESSSHSVDDVDPTAVAKAALEKAEASRAPQDVNTGEYEVVLEPAAVALLMEYLSYAGFGAKQFLDGESFLSTRAGQQIAEGSVTIADDIHHPKSVGIGFDFEGVPKRRVAVIDHGRATGPVTDHRTARKMGTSPTGHYSGSNEFGPYASNLVMEAGDASLEELIAGVRRGLLVTRFHYVNVLDRPSVLLTGMTRDGTWLVERGEVAGPVHNLRFTQSVLGVLSSITRIGRDLEAFAPDYGGFGSSVAPGIHCESFDFTSRTSH
jgi:PmbA protein